MTTPTDFRPRVLVTKIGLDGHDGTGSDVSYARQCIAQHAQQIRERVRVVRIAGQVPLPLRDHLLVERVLLDLPVVTAGGEHGDERSCGQDPGGDQTEASHPPPIIAADPGRARRDYVRIRASSAPRFLRRISIQKSRIARAWVRAIARNRTPSPDARRSSVR